MSSIDCTGMKTRVVRNGNEIGPEGVSRAVVYSIRHKCTIRGSWLMIGRADAPGNWESSRYLIVDPYISGKVITGMYKAALSTVRLVRDRVSVKRWVRSSFSLKLENIETRRVRRAGAGACKNLYPAWM